MCEFIAFPGLTPAAVFDSSSSREPGEITPNNRPESDSRPAHPAPQAVANTSNSSHQGEDRRSSCSKTDAKQEMAPSVNDTVHTLPKPGDMSHNALPQDGLNHNVPPEFPRIDTNIYPGVPVFPTFNMIPGPHFNGNNAWY